MILRILLLVAVGTFAMIPRIPALADEEDRLGLRAVPFAFVATATECRVAGSNIVTAAWLRGVGLPDNGGLNTTTADLRTNPNKRDPHFGFFMSKNGPTPDCSSAGAVIKGFENLVAPIVLGFDYRNGTHCGAGAPRFNVVARPPTGPNTFHFVGGCANDTPTPAPQDVAQWTQVRFNTSNPAQSFPVIPPGSRISSIVLIYDEGTDTPTAEDPRGVGLSVVDNIFINGQFIRRGRGIEPGDEEEGD